MGLKVLIIGYGSIGKKHASLLKNFRQVSSIYVLTKQKCNKFKQIDSLININKINPDYVIICSRTNLHFKYLNYLEKKIKNKIILVEKPLFHKNLNLKIKNNKVFVGYNLRFHPVLKFIKDYIKNKIIFSSSVSCKSYLPNWRKNIDYSKSNSAKKSYGGGVLLELSHEIDYINWLFGGIKKINYSKVKKISNLKINVEDYATVSGETLKSNFNLELNFFSKFTERKIIIDGKNFSIRGDLVENKIEILNERNYKKVFNFKLKKDYTYIKEHQSILNNLSEPMCSFNEGKKNMMIIDKIKTSKTI